MANTLKLGAGKWATGTDTVLAFNDENNNFKPLPFSFSRASSATVVNQSGLIETVGSGEPRIDFQGNTKGALLLEPQRTNAITNSETFGSTGWSFVTAGTAITPIVTDDYAISPDGTQNAQRVQFNLGGGTTVTDRTLIRQNIGSQNDWFLSVYMKSTNGAEQKILWHTSSDSNETIITGEWQRFTFSRNGVSNSWFGLGLRGSVSSVDTADILVYGFQAEQGSYPTSYIPTSGSAVTRVVDACNNGGNAQVINSTEGVLYAEVAALADDGTSRNISIFQNGSNFIKFQYSSTSNRVDFVAFSSGAVSCNITKVISNTTDNNKFALKWKLNDFALWVNGVEVGTDLSGNTPIGMDKISFTNEGGSSGNFYGKPKALAVYNTALSDSELAALTS